MSSTKPGLYCYLYEDSGCSTDGAKHNVYGPMSMSVDSWEESWNFAGYKCNLVAVAGL